MNRSFRYTIYAALLLTLTGCRSITQPINSFLSGDDYFYSYEEAMALSGGNTIEITRPATPWVVRPFSVVITTTDKTKLTRQNTDYYIRDIPYRNNKAIIPVPQKKGYQLNYIVSFNYFRISADINVEKTNRYCYNYRTTTIEVDERFVLPENSNPRGESRNTTLMITPKLTFLPQGTGLTCSKQDPISSGSGGHS